MVRSLAQNFSQYSGQQIWSTIWFKIWHKIWDKNSATKFSLRFDNSYTQKFGSRLEQQSYEKCGSNCISLKLKEIKVKYNMHTSSQINPHKKTLEKSIV